MSISSLIPKSQNRSTSENNDLIQEIEYSQYSRGPLRTLPNHTLYEKSFFTYWNRWTADLIFFLDKSPNIKLGYSSLLHAVWNIFVAHVTYRNVFKKKMLGMLTSFSFLFFPFFSLLHLLLLSSLKITGDHL